MATDAPLPAEPKPASRQVIALDDGGHVQLSDLGQRRTYLTQMLQSGMLPGQFKTVQQLEMAWDLLISMGLPPLPYLPLVVIVNNRLTVMSDALMAACEHTGDLEWVQTIYLDKNNEAMTKENAATFAVFCAVVTVKRRGRPEAWDKFTLDQAEGAGLLKNNVWKQYPADMLMHRARSRVLRQLFSDSIGGIRVKELDEFIPVTDDAGAPMLTPTGQSIVRRRSGPAPDLNAMYAATKTEPPA